MEKTGIGGHHDLIQLDSNYCVYYMFKTTRVKACWKWFSMSFLFWHGHYFISSWENTFHYNISWNFVYVAFAKGKYFSSIIFPLRKIPSAWWEATSRHFANDCWFYLKPFSHMQSFKHRFKHSMCHSRTCCYSHAV